MDVVSASVAASGTVLVYDFLCTFDQEVAYVWSSPWTFGSSLFFLNRYLPFVDTFVSLRLLTSHSQTPEQCTTQFRIVLWFIFFGIFISEIILMLRTYAIWNRRRSIQITLYILCLLVFVPGLVVTQLESASLIYGPSEGGCNLEHASVIIFVAYVLLVISETIIVTLTLIKAFQHLRHTRSSWVVQLYRDGFLFYLYLLGFAVANVIVPVAGPPELANWLATPQRIAHSVLCNRVLFLIFRQRTLHAHRRLPSHSDHSSFFTPTQTPRRSDTGDKISQFFSSFFTTPEETGYMFPSVDAMTQQGSASDGGGEDAGRRTGRAAQEEEGFELRELTSS
ncbi:hypothetical protein PTI98_013129 [Pleurotus ostreatus]|nr:hypothetical protein PTI98_013129 [Pleurotus ostreatus]